MRAFHYSFQKVLDLKTNEKKQAEWVLSQAVGQLQAEEQSLSCLLTELDTAHRGLQQCADECSPAFQLQQWQQYIFHLEMKKDSARQRVQSAERQVRSKQDDLAARMCDEKVWTKAREKAEEQFKKQMALVEQNEMDEIATVRYFTAAR
ncbi:flagellar export protein FliJ [Paenibacillus sp. 481]|uniref:flagellar export protein FliJ n=1 Tax=Paenibacillus sp. 481 TaxID=2835869 RepID=UPI001E4EA318|nr:flagellar export protein FliJ [Paenibacillus sp. 481]UHA73936.1 flagellar export protein FliJ [Paenibacillus sp. 481]